MFRLYLPTTPTPSFRPRCRGIGRSGSPLVVARLHRGIASSFLHGSEQTRALVQTSPPRLPEWGRRRTLLRRCGTARRFETTPADATAPLRPMTDRAPEGIAQRFPLWRDWRHSVPRVLLGARRRNNDDCVAFATVRHRIYSLPTAVPNRDALPPDLE